MDADEVTDALRARYSPAKGWTTVLEVTPFPNGGAAETLEVADRYGDLVIRGAGCRIDMVAWNAWNSNHFYRHAIEVKVSRDDVARELAQPHKRAMIAALCHRYFIAAPKDACNTADLPDDVGLIRVYPDGRTRALKSGRFNVDPPTPAAFVASTIRCAADQRTFDRRCGLYGCRRPARNLHSFDGVRVLVCDPCLDLIPGRKNPNA